MADLAVGHPLANRQERVIEMMGQILGRYRSLRVYLGTCVKCGCSCTAAPMKTGGWVIG
jgi:hypothetical protein